MFILGLLGAERTLGLIQSKINKQSAPAHPSRSTESVSCLLCSLLYNKAQMRKVVKIIQDQQIDWSKPLNSPLFVYRIRKTGFGYNCSFQLLFYLGQKTISILKMMEIAISNFAQTTFWIIFWFYRYTCTYFSIRIHDFMILR